MIDEYKEPAVVTPESQNERDVDPRLGERKFGIFHGKIVEATVLEIEEGPDGQKLYVLEHNGHTVTALERLLGRDIQADLARRKAEQDLAEEILDKVGVTEPTEDADEDVMDISDMKIQKSLPKHTSRESLPEGWAPQALKPELPSLPPEASTVDEYAKNRNIQIVDPHTPRKKKSFWNE